MWLLVGLGNPGSQYKNNRHNIGFMAAEAISRRHNFSDWKKKFKGEISEGVIDREKVMILRPLTFMNASGEAVQAAATFHKIPMERVVVFYDELDIAPGKIRVKRGGGSGGHNGIKSIDEYLPADYWRVRLGIGHPGDKNLVSPYVLGNFLKEDADWLDKLLDAVALEAPRIVDNDMDGFMSKVAAVMVPQWPKKEKEEKDKKDGL